MTLLASPHREPEVPGEAPGSRTVSSGEPAHPAAVSRPGSPIPRREGNGRPQTYEELTVPEAIDTCFLCGAPANVTVWSAEDGGFPVGAVECVFCSKYVISPTARDEIASRPEVRPQLAEWARAYALKSRGPFLIGSNTVDNALGCVVLGAAAAME